MSETLNDKILHEMKEIATMGNFITRSRYVDQIPKGYRRILLKYINRVNECFDEINKEN